jgi:hypothetical protein
MISGFLLKMVRDLKRIQCRRSVKEVHLSSAVSADEGHFPKFFIGIYDYAKRRILLRSIKKTKVLNHALTIQKPNKLLIIHARTDLDTNRIPNPPKILHMRSRHLPRSVPDPKEVCSGIVKCIFPYFPRGSTFINGFSCSTSYGIGGAKRNGEFPC